MATLGEEKQLRAQVDGPQGLSYLQQQQPLEVPGLSKVWGPHDGWT